ncbi:N-glycosylase/DNA lyase [Halorussus ruber]|uniref:N-glycosylase/DNA lyase n=1 Tax=Halorussus ruber TaxID=1126238 RepID=UPI00109304A3|nr:N-glycosylase/DNA lyase [Halorussus ruber]
MATHSARIDALAGALADLGHDGIARFDEYEPEYKTLTVLNRRFDSDAHLALLSVTAGLSDFQLAIDAQAYWESLRQVALDHGSLNSIEDVKTIMDVFMDEPVNARYTQMKRGRLSKLYDYGYPEWFVETYPDHEPRKVWEEAAIGLGGKNKMNQKTVVLGMKIYDIHNLIVNGEYLDFPDDIAIPCDTHVQRVAVFVGLTSTEDPDVVRARWTDVADRVSQILGEPISLLRIDSIVFQFGQIVSRESFDRGRAYDEFVSHAGHVGIEQGKAERLAEELTANL